MSVVGDQPLPGFGWVNHIVVDQLGRIWSGAVNTIPSVFSAAVAAETGRHQILVGGQAELSRIGEAFLQQSGNVEGNDFGIDSPQLPKQFIVESAAELRDERLQGGAIEQRGQAQIRQHPDHDVTCAGLLQGAYAVHQAASRSIGLLEAGRATLIEIVGATRQVVQGIRIGAKVIAYQIAGAATASDGGDGGNRVEYLVGPITTHRPIVAVRQPFGSTCRRSRTGELVGRESKSCAQQLRSDGGILLSAAIQIGWPRAIGCTVRRPRGTTRVRNLSGGAETVAEDYEIGVRPGGCHRLSARQRHKAEGKGYEQTGFDHEQARSNYYRREWRKRNKISGHRPYSRPTREDSRDYASPFMPFMA
ncbi:hypothetical protein CSC33_1472 [Pseudomonas aeruginosa]|nr:hypothetical protein CSC33_1472 [Pseudomonas aeruginosa]